MIVSDPHVENTTEVAPTYLGSLPDDQMCHITDAYDNTYCGAAFLREIHGEFRGEAVCPVCGYPTCPRCAQLCQLDLSLDDFR